MYSNCEIENEFNRLKSEYKELYVVRCFLEQKDVACTDLWYMYSNLNDAARWIELAHAYDHIRWKENCEDETEFSLPSAMDVGSKWNPIKWEYTDGKNTILNTFLIRRLQ